MNTIELTELHRAQQLLLRQATVAQLRKLWPMLDWARLDATFPDFAVAVGMMVQANRQTSSGLASAYLRAFRQSSGVPGEVKAVFAEPLPVDQFTNSLRVTSVVSAKAAAARGEVASIAMGNALTTAEGAVTRLVLNAGRETLTNSLRADSKAYGWQRVVGGSGCDFCRMLAGRGAVYKQRTVDFAAHDHCGCTIAPIYGGRSHAVKAFVPTTRTVGDVDRARVRDWMAANPGA